MRNDVTRYALTLLLVMALAVGANGCAIGGAGVTNFDSVTLSNDLVIGDDLTVASTSSLVGDVTASADVVVGLFGRLTAQTRITVTQDSTITPTGTYQPIGSAGNLGTSDIAITTAGDVVILTNETNTTITISDTGTTMLSGNIALSQYDTLTLLCDGTNWLELANSTN